VNISGPALESEDAKQRAGKFVSQSILVIPVDATLIDERVEFKFEGMINNNTMLLRPSEPLLPHQAYYMEIEEKDTTGNTVLTSNANRFSTGGYSSETALQPQFVEALLGRGKVLPTCLDQVRESLSSRFSSDTQGPSADDARLQLRFWISEHDLPLSIKGFISIFKAQILIQWPNTTWNHENLETVGKTLIACLDESLAASIELFDGQAGIVDLEISLPDGRFLLGPNSPLILRLR